MLLLRRATAGSTVIVMIIRAAVVIINVIVDKITKLVFDAWYAEYVMNVFMLCVKSFYHTCYECFSRYIFQHIYYVCILKNYIRVLFNKINTMIVTNKKIKKSE